MEYWRSSPYLLNFMEGYQLKQALRKACKDPGQMESLVDALENTRALLDWQGIASYLEVDPGNARLRSLLSGTVDQGAWRLLWIPPSLPYYRLGGPYAEPGLGSFTKRLVFSSWVVVPKVISTLCSYEAERRMICSFDASAENTPEARRRRTALLRFGRAEGRLTGMPVLGLIYPSSWLARECDPLALAGVIGGSDGIPSQSELVKDIQRRMEPLLSDFPSSSDEGGLADEAGTWRHPPPCHPHEDAEGMREWLGQYGLDAIWSAQKEPGENSDDSTAWAAHIGRVRELAAGQVRLGPKPGTSPSVLAQMAIASPGVTTLRALARISGGTRALTTMSVRNSAAQVAWSFLHLFNLPEVIALIRGMNGEEPYWRRVLEYCVDGGLQPALDEYAHVLCESLGVAGGASDKIASEVSAVMRRAVGLRTASLGLDEIRIDTEQKRIEVDDKKRMRAGFALRFGEDRTEDGFSEPNRADQVRDAFNSPFWPFVVATTSVGQEGLDFHLYCHAVVHWNLPSNPVDLEQREGRVHRYKGHAVRRNVAQTHGSRRSRGGSGILGDLMFDGARKIGRPRYGSRAVLGLSTAGGARIERHVPALPLSRDRERCGAASVARGLSHGLWAASSRGSDLLLACQPWDGSGSSRGSRSQD